MVIPKRNVLNLLVTQHIGNTTELASNAITLGILQEIVPKMIKIEKVRMNKVTQILTCSRKNRNRWGFTSHGRVSKSSTGTK